MLDINKVIAKRLTLPLFKVEGAIKLLDEGNTIPFIARYRKEMTGNLNDEELRKLSEEYNRLMRLEERKKTVINTIKNQNKLTDELNAKIENITELVELEDLYRPYRPKKQSRSTIAVDKGLKPLAQLILDGVDQPLTQVAGAFIKIDDGITDEHKALAMAGDIIAEMISDNGEIRQIIRNYLSVKGHLHIRATDEKKDSVYRLYYAFSSPLKHLEGYQILAIDRGEKQGFLQVKIEVDDDIAIGMIKTNFLSRKNSYTDDFLSSVVEDAYKRLIYPSVQREIRNELTNKAQNEAIEIFKHNLKQLLLTPPLADHTILGWDPAFRTGCKLAIIDPTGKVLATKVVYVTPPAGNNQIEEGIKDVLALIEKHHVTLIALGNGTASRESEMVIAKIIRQAGHDVKYIITSEAGASIYSASKLAAAEFPDYDVGQRSAVSIARRVQDPLAELVKIDPKGIGIGQYQHDMNQKRLDEALASIVEDTVNEVGVDLNTASYSLLSHIAGINQSIAKNIVAHREQNGPFTKRSQLLKINKLGPKTYEQCAGFLRIEGGDEPLDNTAIHPESYDTAAKLIDLLALDEDFGLNNRKKIITELLADQKQITALAIALDTGEATLTDILKELCQPGRDPRKDAPPPVLRQDILTLDDLSIGTKLKGTVRNITDFGAFVDIGVHEDGLIHKSKISRRYVKDPLAVVHLNDVVEVTVVSIDKEKKRIGLSLID